VSNSGTVQRIYQYFGQGDVAAILNLLAEDIDWEYGGGSTDVPWLQKREGRAAVGAFFQALTAMEFHRFEPKMLLESGNVIVALVDLEATVRATGKRIVEEDEVHIWHFGDDGQVTRFRHRADTYLQWAAYHGT
jgi:ketosteroid isomerase-like protein